MLKNDDLKKKSKNLNQVEAINERRERVLLVIKARWAVMGSYLLYAILAAIWFIYKHPEQISTSRFIFYSLGITSLFAYNALLYLSYERVSAIKGIAQAQMVIDVLITTLVIYFTGGTASWFWSTYLLIILQTAFLFDRKIEALEIAALSGLSFGLLTVLQTNGLLGSYNLAFILQTYTQDAAYESLKVFWVIASGLAVAFIASYLMGVIRQRERYLAKKSITDGLTSLFNHSHFHNRIDSEIMRAKRYHRSVSLILIDVDDFKQYNDNFGHQEGDRVLKEVAKIFSKSIRQNDVDMAFRYGGEEFAIIAPETNSQTLGLKESGAISLANRIRASVEEKLPISISVGVASLPHHADSAEELFRAADAALYRAKERGKNCVVIYAPSLSKKIGK